MDNESSLYELTKQLTTLQHLRDKQQQSLKIKSKLQLRDIIKECFNTFDDIVAIPPAFCDNAVEKEGTEVPHLEIERKNGPYLQDLKEKIGELFAAEEMQTNEIILPDNLEECMGDLRTEIHEQKEQLKLHTCLSNNFEAILENNFYTQTSDGNRIQGVTGRKIECDSIENESM